MPEATPADQAVPASTQITRTTLARRWVRKTVIFLSIFFVLGVWGLYDAVWLYPTRGRTDAEYRRFAYLQQSERDRRLGDASIPDPVARYAQLREASSGSDLDRVKLEWLQSLSRVGMLTPEQTTFANPAGELERLRKEWTSKEKPNPLNAWDIPFQWVITAVGFAGAAWVLVGFFRTKGQVYRWEPGSRRLTLPSGVSLVPGEIAEFDKRRWHKFFVTIVAEQGRRHELDLYKHEPLEQWVLEMEQARFPEPAEVVAAAVDEPGSVAGNQ